MPPRSMIRSSGQPKAPSSSVTSRPLAARAVFDATSRFHNPVHTAQGSDPGIDAAFEAVWSLVLAGLRAGADSK